MDWDLWSAPYDPEDHSLCTTLEWRFDFCFRYGLDVIEEDALKEKYCIQVMRILITKADSEIDELEQDLIILQSELAWIEYEEWFEIGYNALMAKLDYLDTWIKSLRNEDSDGIEVHLLMHTQPVERLHEILQALLGNYFCKKDPEPKNDDITDSSCHPLKQEVGFSAEGINSNRSCSISVQTGKDNKRGFYLKEPMLVQIFPSTCVDKERHHYVQKLDMQPTNVVVNNGISDALKHGDGGSNAMIKSSSLDSPILSGDFEENSAMVIKSEPGEKDVYFEEVIAAKKLKCSNKLNETENADIGLCNFNVHNCQEELYECSSNGTDETATKEPHEGPLNFTSKETDEPTMKEVTEREDRKERNPLDVFKVEKENCALTLLLEQQEEKCSNAIMLQPKEEVASRPEVEMSVVAGDKKKFNFNLSRDSQNLSQVGITKMIVDSSSSFILNGKKRQKSVATPSLNPEWKTIKRELGENGDEKLNSYSLPWKKAKNGWNIPLISEFPSDTTEDDPSAKPLLICDSHVQPIPSYAVMEKMKVPDLRKIAKSHKLSKYSQLIKKELIQMLACKNGELETNMDV